MAPARLLVPLAIVALVATGCEDPAATAVRSSTAPTTAPAATPTRAATPTATPTATRVARPTTPAPRKPVQAAAVPTRRPAPAPTTAKPKPKPVVASTCGAPANPWGYNFCGRGSFVSRPPATFCDYFDCIDSFWENTKGYVMQCDDLTFSHSGGRSGSCSHHGGNNRPLYG